jgi:hypothetical protein
MATCDFTTPITRDQFERELRKSRTLRELGDRCEWRAGFERGLRRGFYGAAFSTQVEHELWLSAASSADPMRADQGRGYRAGLALAVGEVCHG